MKPKKIIEKELETWESYLEADIEHKTWRGVYEDSVFIKALKWVLED